MSTVSNLLGGSGSFMKCLMSLQTLLYEDLFYVVFEGLINSIDSLTCDLVPTIGELSEEKCTFNNVPSK